MNREEIYKKIEKSDMVFTDIFDTLLYRKNFPDYNKQIWCEAIKKYYNLKKNINDIVKLREKEEIKLRNINQSKGFDLEFDFDQLIDRLYKKLRIKDSLNNFRIQAKKFEVEIECSSLEIYKDSLELLEFCKQNKKQIVCVSDMYLTKDMLNEIIKRVGLESYISDIIVSSEFLYSKSTGNLYDIVKKKYRKNISNSIMLGDNYNSDYLMSTKKGFLGIFLDRNYMYDIYSQNKIELTEKKYLKKLGITKEFYIEFDYELNLFYKLIDINILINKNNIKVVTCSSETKDLLERLKIINGDLYYSFDVDFEISNDDPIIYSEENSFIININGKSIKIEKEKMNMDCFITIVNNLINKVIDKKEVMKNLKDCQKTQISHNKNPLDKKALENLGKEYVPIFEDFLRWINNSIEKENISKIYFFTREGEFFKQVFDKIKNKNTNSDILEVSRVATFFASFDDITIEEMSRLWSQYSIQSMSAMFKSLNLNINKYVDVLYKNGLNISDKVVYPMSCYKIQKLFKDKEFLKLMREDLKIVKSDLIGYLNSHGVENKTEKIAIVDIGWRGTIQDNVCKILSNKTIYGYYFGLQQFLNKQPKNSKKFGYLNQFYGGSKVLGDVTPFEMLCNSCNGSTIGYKKEKNKYVAIRKIDQKENESYFNCTKYIQAGVIKNVGKRKYSNDEPFEVLNKIIYAPSKLVTNTYFNLKHNEEFGVGEFVSKKSKISKSKIIKSTLSYDLALNIRNQLQNTSWPHGYLVNNGLEKYIDKLPLQKLNEFDKVKVTKKIAFIMPDLLEGSGGHRTIIENANYLVKKGYQCDLYFNDDMYLTSDELTKKIKKLFDECLCQVFVGLNLRTKYDMIFATYNVITPEIVKNADCENKMYFVQDYEPWFNPMGDGYIFAEGTYSYGFKCITIGNWLSNKLIEENNAEARSFPFCANLNIYKPIKTKKENAICFIFQPDKSRRCVELGLKALRIVKTLKPDVKIYLYGSKQQYYVDFEHENLKIISLNKCNELYNKCKVGLCISSSNPSRIPFEMMAAGLPVVDLYRENNLYDMPSNGVTLAKSTPESIATEIINLLDNPKLAEEKSKFGIKYMKDYDLKVGFEQFYKIVKETFEKKGTWQKKYKLLYTNKPNTDTSLADETAKQFKFIPFSIDSTDYLRNLAKKKHRLLFKVNRFKLIKKLLNKLIDLFKKLIRF